MVFLTRREAKLLEAFPTDFVPSLGLLASMARLLPDTVEGLVLALLKKELAVRKENGIELTKAGLELRRALRSHRHDSALVVDD